MQHRECSATAVKSRSVVEHRTCINVAVKMFVVFAWSKGVRSTSFMLRYHSYSKSYLGQYHSGLSGSFIIGIFIRETVS